MLALGDSISSPASLDPSPAERIGVNLSHETKE